ncbi:ABC transporter permease [Heliophilum fasciatum]|uniref:Putative ABC transport system permease protein n=1 Tax=Heliophilum fasciatum TaxID=35700 RepID=A0A4R2RJ65_9FIRM|nr:iron export ABC transporter permease subunit FetB [Heliophilum fasciatum]MCW2279473.1 putative ABC transport system permease protein [Heliophilum fasciatum]TCP59701.1 putative ABC transport system permease protein [Heliophilum fasciatum]
MTTLHLALALGFVLIAMVISYRQQLALEKSLLIGTVRAVVQLLFIGYVLQLIFDLNSWSGLLALLLIMVAVASHNAAGHAKTLPRQVALLYMAGSLLLSALITLGLLIGLGIISTEPRYIIPLSGMIIGNAMIAAGLTLNRLQAELASGQGQINALLCLGATVRQATAGAIKAAVRAGMSPTIDGMKTVGLVQLPGMMTGQIIAGASPIEAVKYQILIQLVLTASTSITSMAVGIWFVRPFFTKDLQPSEYYPRPS